MEFFIFMIEIFALISKTNVLKKVNTSNITLYKLILYPHSDYSTFHHISTNRIQIVPEQFIILTTFSLLQLL